MPGSTPGTDLRLAGQDLRVPSISGITVCSEGLTAPLVAIDTAGHGSCLSPCLSVLLVGNDADVGPITVSYSADGVVETTTNDPASVEGPGSECLLSIGSPDAPYPTCFNAIGPDLGDPLADVDELADVIVSETTALAGTALALANDAVDDAEAVAAEAGADALALVADARQDAEILAAQILAEATRALEPVESLVENVRDTAEDPCAQFEPQWDPDYWNEQVEFCENPTLWAQWYVRHYCYQQGCVVDPQQVVEAARQAYCLVAPNPPSYCPE